MKIILTSLLLIFAFQVSFGQEKARLVDEFGRIYCDDFLFKWQNFQLTILASSNSTGYLLVFINPNKSENNKYFQQFREYANGLIEMNNLNRSQFLIAKAETDQNFKAQFWLVPNGAEIPSKYEIVKDAPIPRITKPVLFHKDTWESGICPSDKLRIYAETLKSDIELQGNIVIYDSTTKSILETQNTLIKEFESKYKISRNHLKFFHRRNRTIFDVEYWLVPKKKT
ncbi:MAG TPA: hypothetical protein PKY82_16975 [Pyrinomonadaceae bacterium]|nr:hypothetical protein [Pyrinomonadaceae bacterium]